MKKTKQLVDCEGYKGYVIKLYKLDWDADFYIYKGEVLVHKCQDRADAKKWIDDQTK